MIDGPDPNRMWQFHFYFTRLSCRRLTWSLSRTISQLGQTETEIIYTETLSIQFQQTFPTEGHISNRRRPTVHRCSCRHSINLVRTASRIDFSLGAWCNRKLCHLPKSSKVLETVNRMSIWRFERKNFNLKIPCWVLLVICRFEKLCWFFQLRHFIHHQSSHLHLLAIGLQQVLCLRQQQQQVNWQVLWI